MKQYQELADVTGTVTERSTLDAAGSTVDQIFTAAIMASMPTLIVEQKNLMRAYEVPGQTDIATVPVFKNFDLSFTDLSGTGSDTGSSLSMTGMNAITYVKIQPVLQSAGVFITETALLLTNKASFEEHVQRISTSAARYMDRTILNGTVLSESAASTNLYAAGGFTSAGSVSAGSTLGPFDLDDAKTLLSTGSDVYVPDVVVMHPNQYNQLLQSTDFRGDTYRVSDKATFVGGELVSYNQMEVVVSELVNAGAGGYYASAGHPVSVFNRKVSAAFARKSAAERIRTWNDIVKHGTYVIVDLMFDYAVLIPESIVIVRAAD